VVRQHYPNRHVSSPVHRGRGVSTLRGCWWHPLGSDIADEALQAPPVVISMVGAWRQRLSIIQNQPIRDTCEWL